MANSNSKAIILEKKMESSRNEALQIHVPRSRIELLSKV